MSIGDRIREVDGRFGMLAFVAFVPALISTLLAGWSAATTGEVVVYVVGKTSIFVASVPWIEAWARFACPVVLAGTVLVQDPRDGRESLLFPILRVAIVWVGLGMFCSCSFQLN